MVTYVGPPGGSSRAVLSSQVHFGSRRGWSILVVKEAGPFLQARSVFRATGWPSSCAFEGRYAPRSPDPRTKDETPSPQLRFDAARGSKQRGEHQPSKPLAWREKLSRPRSPASTPRFDVPPEHRSCSWNMPLVAIQC